MSLPELLSPETGAVAALSGLAGVLGRSLIDGIFRSKQRTEARAAALMKQFAEEEARFRKDVMDQMDRLQNKVAGLEKELDEWKREYFELYRKNAELQRDSIHKDAQITLLTERARRCEEEHGQPQS
jgi:chromosome segregation ATPase